MKFNLIETKEITDFEKEIGFELEVTERRIYVGSSTGLLQYYVNFEGGEVMFGGCLSGCHGNGKTIDEALMDYARQISCVRMVFGAYTKNRKEISLPKLIHTKLLNK